MTCRHVVEGFTNAVFTFVGSKEGTPVLGDRCAQTVLRLNEMAFFHPDTNLDIAIIPLKPILDFFESNGKIPYYTVLDPATIPTVEQAKDLSAVHPILFVGYPSGMRDEANLIPIFRRGFTASPYVVDFNALPLFLIDASVFPGSSGSPVLVFEEGMHLRGGSMVFADRIYFLGIVSSAYFREEKGEVQFRTVPSKSIGEYSKKLMLNIGGVIKARALEDTISEFLKLLKVQSDQVAPTPPTKPKL